MGELDALLQKKEELMAKIQRIAESCEGIENESNAAKVAELNGRQAELLAQKDELKSRLAVIDGELGAISQKIRDLSGAGVERILQAIKNQRWYFFKNKPKVIMDKDTALLWVNLDYFPYKKDVSENDGMYHLRTGEHKDLITRINSDGIENFSFWRVPTPRELWSLVDSDGFPYCSPEPDYLIKNFNYWAVCVDGNVRYKDLNTHDMMGSISDGWAYILPCTEVLTSTDYKANISPDNTLYTEQEKLQMTLDIFTQNELIPIFDDEEITKLYRQIYVDKPILLRNLSEIEAKISELQGDQVKLTANFNYKPILAKYDIKAVDTSVIQYYESVLSVTDTILGILQEYETAQSETISEFSHLALQLEAKYTDSPHLTEDENDLLRQRQQFLAERLELGMDDVKEQILSLREQANHLAARLAQITHGKNAMRELAELESEPRVSFAFLVENLARIVREAQQNADFFAWHRPFVTNIVNEWASWSEDYKAFKTNMREELTAICRDDGIDEEVYSLWYKDWQKKRFIIEGRFLPLVEFALKGNLLSDDDTPAPAEQVLQMLQNYKDAVDSFYLHERKNIYQKFAFQAGGDLQEKFETESEFYKFTEKLQHNLSEIIFSRSKTEDRMFLLRWSEPLLNVPIDEIVSFVAERELVAISADVMEQFATLKRQNFAAYLADSQAYSKELQKREKEYNALVFRMRKDLQKQ